MITVDSATGNGWDELGKALEAAGEEDASGSRRHYFQMMQEGRWSAVALLLNITMARAKEIYAAIQKGD